MVMTTMTTHYLDIQLRPNPELAAPHLLGGLYGRLHRALVQAQSQEIGVSFPRHDDRQPSLGNQLRLHGAAAALERLMAGAWLRGMEDYLERSPIQPVPATAQYRVVSRVQAKSNVDRLRRRAIKRHGLTVQEAEARLPLAAEERLALPFITLGSISTDQPAFPLFIRHGPVLSSSTPGVFNSYGLSRDATIPWF